MASLMHIAETAVLLFVAYQAGWFVAFFSRRLLSPSSRPAAVAAERLAKANGEVAEAAVAVAVPATLSPAPVIATPALASPAPIPAPATITLPRPRASLTPAAATPTPPPAIPTLAETAPEASFLSVLEAHEEEPAAALPKLPEGPAGGEAALAAVRDAIGITLVAPTPAAPEPVKSVAPAPAPYETPAQFDTAPPEVASPFTAPVVVESEDHLIAIDAPVEVEAEVAAVPLEDAFPAAPEPIVPVAAEDVEFVFEVDPGRSPEAEPADAEAEPEPPPPPRQLKPASRPGEAWSGRPVPPSPTILTSAVEAALDPPSARSTAAPNAPTAPAVGTVANAEAEAMRAIEGGWTRRPSTRPAEAAARSGPGPVAQAAPTRPPALLEPREGGKDDLRLIEGLRPADEAALNALGIFHFDQIAQWNRPAIEWLELHQIGAGRVTGEKWVEQAQLLTSIASSARAVGG